jgi:DsbC/DsbD-like thiol-disulfide interchange protein
MRRRHKSLCLSRAITLVAALLLFAAGARAASAPIPHGTLELIVENQWITPGHEFHLGLHFQLEKGWHIYWVNPGDSGEPPRVKWQLPAGLTAGEMQWPTPRRLGSATIMDFGYENEVMLLVPMHAAGGFAVPGPTQIGAEVRVLVCREMCIPGKAQLSLTLPVKSQPPVPDASAADLIAAARNALPRPAPSKWRLTVVDGGDSFLLSASVGQHIAQASFFPFAESQLKDAAPQQFAALPGGFRLTLRKSDQLLKPIERLKGVLVLAGDRGYLIDVPVSRTLAARRDARNEISPEDSSTEVKAK